ncbi:MAG: hypothetical protein JXR97_10920 [Planctomycetes bacterium]|nr:hypothetical protein [Planctomycetota bacterium]
MCLITFIIWFILIAISVGISASNTVSGETSAIIGFTCIILGIVLPIIANYWRPAVSRWPMRKKRLMDKLMSEGVLVQNDIENGGKYVLIWRVLPGSEKKIPKTTQEAFVVFENNSLRILGEKECFTTDTFSVIPRCTGRCSRCWVIWACGGDSTRLKVRVKDEEREYLFQCREGRTLRSAAKATEMIEEIMRVSKPGEAGPEPEEA